MSTHRFIPAKRKGKCLPFLFMLGGLLLTFSLLLPATALAAPRSAAAALPLTKPQQIVDLAGVSVVRLSLEYLPANAKGSSIFCTTLGTIIASWPAQNANDKNNWVLTDGSLLNQSTKNTCAPGGTLASIKIFASNGFTNNQPASAQLGLLACTAASVCSDSLNGTAETILTPVNNAVLFSFHTSNPLPYVDVEKAVTTGNPAPTSIELANSKNAIPSSAKNVDSTILEQFLTPIANATAPGSAPTLGTVSAQINEPGTPYIDGNGKITGAQLFNPKSLVTIADIENLENQLVLPPGQTLSQLLNKNTLSQQWDTGIIEYEQGKNSEAVQTLSSIKNAPAAFLAPAAFKSKAQAKIPTINGTPGSTSAATHGQGNQGAFSFLGIPLLVIGLIAGVLVLVSLFLIVSIVFGRKRIERKRELDGFKADEETARQSVAGKERQIQVPQQYSPSPLSYGGPVNYPPVVAAPPAPALPLMPAQPQAASISDVPTTEIPTRNGSISPESERTMPFSVQQLQGRNLGLAVITETNPGIKRKHKPNEDSLFAMQGARTHNSQPQQFGLFVVADGMGGHANGQDASRTAIQKIIDFMLPRISMENVLNDEGYKNLLVEGVQQANLAVHQRNLQDHADMGTTMTAALVVGSTAYVANVGDSRTYLYREPQGLRQITHDHSVVASLVDAGIIKPDDIYTHPKRNQIYRSLGEKPGVEIDSFIQPLQANDKLLLCSDGLWDMVRDPEIQRVVSTSIPTPTQLGKNLIQAALDGGGEDNVSVIVVSITGEAGHTGMTGIHLHAKPDTVTVPDMPNM
jgi:serine/threonine protein phosphatase PrpC